MDLLYDDAVKDVAKKTVPLVLYASLDVLKTKYGFGRKRQKKSPTHGTGGYAMASRYENQCISCDTCIGRHCPKRNVEIIVCDDCGDDIEGDIYEVDGAEVCESCLKSRFVRLS